MYQGLCPHHDPLLGLQLCQLLDFLGMSGGLWYRPAGLWERLREQEGHSERDLATAGRGSGAVVRWRVRPRPDGGPRERTMIKNKGRSAVPLL